MPGASSIRASGGGVDVRSGAVAAGAVAGAGAGCAAAPGPGRARGGLDGHRRAVAARGASVADLRAGVFRPGWSRLVLELTGPMLVTRPGWRPRGRARCCGCGWTRRRRRTLPRRRRCPSLPEWAAPVAADLPRAAPRGDGPMVVVLDPGHGGIDPGAERDERDRGGADADLCARVEGGAAARRAASPW